MDNLPHKGRVFAPWPHEPPEGWPYEYVAKVDYDALAARLAAMERGGVCIWCGEAMDLTDDSMEAAVDWVRKHDAECPDSPLRARLAELEREIARLKRRDNWADPANWPDETTDSASACQHDLQEPYTTIAVRGEDFNEAKCSVCGEEWRLPSTVTGAP
jgi:hypothetical protein